MATAGPNDVILVMTPAQAREVLAELVYAKKRIAEQVHFLVSPEQAGQVPAAAVAEADEMGQRYARMRNVTERLARALDDGFVGV